MYKGVTTYLDVGISKRVDGGMQECWRPKISFTVGADEEVFRVKHGPFELIMLDAAEETIQFKSEAHDVPPVKHARWKKLY